MVQRTDIEKKAFVFEKLTYMLKTCIVSSTFNTMREFS